MERHRELRQLAEKQRGLLTTADLHELGITRAARRGYVDRGELVPAGRRVFRIGGVAPTPRQSLQALCLDTGGVASHRSAAWLHRLNGFGAFPLEVTVARPLHGAPFGPGRIHTTRHLPPDDLVTVDGVASLSVARTLLSLAALVPDELAFDRVQGAVDEAVALGLATDPWLWWRLEKLRRSGRNGVTVFEAILTGRAGGSVTESWLEREALRVLTAAGIPAPLCQERIAPRGAFVARVDFLYPDRRLVIEVSGYRFHRTKAQTIADAERRRALTLAGYTVLEYTYDDVVKRPAAMVAEVVQALGRRPHAA